MIPHRGYSLLICLLVSSRCWADDLPIKRVELPPERIAAEMERVGRGVLTQLPREQFEDLVRKAAAAEQAGKDPPRLVEARYQARLEGNGLAGTAEWKVAHRHDVPGWLPLGGMQLALRSARWSDDAPAVIAPLDSRPGGEPELLVSKKGEQKLQIQWSARGIPEPGGVRFDLRLAACLITSLELELPADHSVFADRESVVLSGPLPGTDASKRVWRLTFSRPAGGAPSARVSIRRPPPADQPAPLVRTLMQTTQRLAPGQVDCEFQFDVQVQRGDVQKLLLELDPGLRPLDLQAPGLDRWTVGTGNQVEVEFREPFRSGRLTLRAVAPIPLADERWTSPGIRIASGLTRGERLTLQIDPDLRLEDWRPGGFRALPTPDAGPMQTVLLQSVSLGEGAGTRPSAKVRSVAGAFRTRETWVWQVEPERMALTAQVQVIPRRGPVFLCVWQVPIGWQVERVEAEPFDASLRWSIQPGTGGAPALLTIEPRRPFSNDSELAPRRLMIRLRSSGPTWVSALDSPSTTVTSPALLPNGAESREGTLTLRLHPSLSLAPGSAILRPDAPQPFRGRPEANVALRHRRGRFQAQCDAEATLNRDSLRTTYRLTLTPTTAAGQEFLVAASAPLTFSSWRTVQGAVQVRRIARLPFPGALWRVSLDRPLTEAAAIELTAAPQPIQDRVEVPILSVPGAERAEGRVMVRSVPGVPWQADADGSVAEPLEQKDDGWTRQAFRLGPQSRRFVLDRGVRSTADVPQLADAALVIQPSVEGPTRYELRFRIGHWPNRELPIGLPADAQLLSLRVNGVAADSVHSQSIDPTKIIVPWNPARGWGDLEIAYTLAGGGLQSWAHLNTTEPTLPLPGRIRQIWRLPAGIVPVSSGDWSTADDSDWTDWERSSGESPGSLWVIRWWAPVVAGCAFAIALLLCLVAASARPRIILSIWLLVTALGLIWLPPSLWGLVIPTLVLAFVIVVVLSIQAWRRRTPVASTAALGLTLALLAGLPGTAASPEPTTVYIVPGSAPGQQSVLAVPELLESLRKSARQSEPASGAVLREARYEGLTVGTDVRWKALFSAVSFRDTGATIAIALPDAQLLGAEVDGRAALPRMVGERGRFEFELPGRGEHTLTLQFTTPVTGEQDRETRFAVPELPLSSCSVALPAGATDMHVLSARGVQRQETRAEAPWVHADLGRTGVVQVRWRTAGAAPTARTPLQTVHLWEMAEAQARLISVFRFRFGAASIRRLEFDLPADFELVDAFIRRVDDPLGVAGLNGIADWRRTDVNGRARHRLDFVAPLTGQVQIELEVVPRIPIRKQLALGFPDVVGDFERETAAAVRGADLNATVVTARGWERISTEDFLHDLWQPLRVDTVNREPDLAFRRTREPGAELRLEVKHAESAATGLQQIQWLVGPGRAELQASATWPEANNSGPLEWDVPAVVNIAEVRGEGLRSWSRTGSRLQAWLAPNPAGGPVTLSLSGSVPRPIDSQANAETPFTAPPMTAVGPTRVSTELTVQAREGWRLSAQATGPYVLLPTNDLPGIAWSGLAATPGPAVFALQPARALARGDVVTIVEMSGRTPTYTTTFDVEPRNVAENDSVATLLLELRRASGDRPQLMLPAGVRPRETRTTPFGTTWVLDCRPGQTYRFVLSGKLLASSAPFVVPNVMVRGAGETTPTVRRFVALAPGIRPAAVAGLEPAVLPNRPRVADQKEWRVVDDNWELRVGGSNDAKARGQVVVEVAATPSIGGQWLVRSNCFVVSESDLSVRMPEGAELLFAHVDGRELPRGREPGRLTVPGVAAQSRVLTLVWRTPAAERPKLELPRLEAGGEVIPFAAVSWKCLVPSGSRIEPITTPVSAATAAERHADAVSELARGTDATRRDAEPYADEFLRGSPTYWFTSDASPPEFRVHDDRPDHTPRIVLSIAVAGGLLAGALIRRRHP